MAVEMEKIVSLCKRRGFIFQSSEIYGGLGSTWDYGPLGVELKRNVKDAWWRSLVYEREDIYGLDAAILMHPQVWEASGHAQGFADPFLKCSACSKHFRADRIWEEIEASAWFTSLGKVIGGHKDSSCLLKWAKREGKKLAPNLALVKYPEETISWIVDLPADFEGVGPHFKNFVGRVACSRDGVAKTPCPKCGNPLPEETSSAHLMLKTSLGPVEETAEKVYLRPETAQGIFVNFANILDKLHPKLPFGIAQIGKAFRNEITTGNFIFRTREFEQMEIEYFVKPEEAQRWYEYWRKERLNWYIRLGMKRENLRIRPHQKEELAHYAKACSDIEYNFPFGWSELEGIANRTDFDLRRHMEVSGKDLTYFEEESKVRILPYIIEPSGGIDRTVLAFLVDSYREEKVRGEKRVVLGLDRRLAPNKVAVLPLLRNRPEIVSMAKKIWEDLRGPFRVTYDDTASIGRLYRRQDEVGTLMCITVDVQSLDDKKVTIRDRDTMEQDRVSIDKLKGYLSGKLANDGR